MRRTGRFEKGAKLPLDFTHRIRYNKSRSKAMRRCVGMADEGDSKSLVLITRVGSTPTTGIKKRTSPACLGEFSFLSAACERVEQHGPALQGERSALRAVAQCAGDPHHRHCKQLEIERFWAVFLFLLSFLYFGVFWEDIDDCIRRGHLTGEIQMCMDLKRIIPPFKPSPRRLPSILTITITAESKRKQNGCLPSKFREASMMDS